jgi:hypothetical protein
VWEEGVVEDSVGASLKGLKSERDNLVFFSFSVAEVVPAKAIEKTTSSTSYGFQEDAVLRLLN